MDELEKEETKQDAGLERNTAEPKSSTSAKKNLFNNTKNPQARLSTNSFKNNVQSYLKMEKNQKTDFRESLGPQDQLAYASRENDLEMKVLQIIDEQAEKGDVLSGWVQVENECDEFLKQDINISYEDPDDGEVDMDADKRSTRKIAATFNAYYYLGLSQYEQKKYQKAAENFKKALKFSPHNPELYYYIGMSYLKFGRYNTSIDYLNDCINYDQTNIYAINNLAYVRNISGMYNDAINICEKHEKHIDQNSPAFYMYLRNWTYALIKEKYFVDAILNIRRAIEINPKDPENWLMWGTVQKINGDFSSSKNKFEIALQIDPDHSLAKEELYQKGLDMFIQNISDV